MEVLLAVENSAAPSLAEVLSEEPCAVDVLIALSEEGAEEPRVAEGGSQEPPRACPKRLSRLLEVSLEEQEVVPEMEIVASCGL